MPPFVRQFIQGPECLLARVACDTKARSNALKSEGSLMAVDTSGGHPAMDYPEHLRTYSGFLKATVGLVVLIVAILLFLLTLVP
jgi:hypothetical protein